MAGADQFTRPCDRAVQAGKAFGHSIPRVRFLQQILALGCNDRRCRVLKKFKQGHALSVKEPKGRAQSVCHKRDISYN